MLCILRLTESPEYLYMFQRYTACKEVLKVIARWNVGEKDFGEYYLDKEKDMVEIKISDITGGKNYKESKIKEREYQEQLAI